MSVANLDASILSGPIIIVIVSKYFSVCIEVSGEITAKKGDIGPFCYEFIEEVIILVKVQAAIFYVLER